MKKFITFFKIEGKISLRSLDGWIFGILMPMGIMLLIGSLSGDMMAMDTNYTFIQGSFAALLTVGICATAFMGIPLTIADFRDKKILKHYCVTPVSPKFILFVQFCICALISILSALCVSIVSVIVFDYQMQGNLLFFIGAYFLVLFSMYGIGLMIASVCKTLKIANLVTSLVYFPMVFISGATIPYELFPEMLQKVADVLPLTHGIKLLKNVSLGIYSDQMWTSIILLVVFAIVGSIISVVSFKWE